MEGDSGTDKPRFARAQLPTDLDENLQSLICDCWNAEPSLRPSFQVVELRLQMIVKATAFSRGRGVHSEKIIGLLRSRPSAETKDEAEKRKANAIKLCKDILGLAVGTVHKHGVRFPDDALVAAPECSRHDHRLC